MFADTIVALSSGALPAGVAVVRLSGPAVKDVVSRLAGSVPPPRTARYVALHLPDGSVLDRGLVLYFPAPASFTGEDCAEFQLHGGRAVVQALLKHVASLPGCRLASAGEFTRRAFLNGKMDLLAAEAAADIISAETEAQRRFAVANSQGRNSELYASWRTRLLRARAFVEAELDFVDETDVPDSAAEAVWGDIDALVDEMERHIDGFRKAEIVREGFDVVLLGAPNTGKSSLLNALAQREAAIVTDEPGTTRDLIEVVLDIDGSKVRVTDTAGIRDAMGKVEQLGIQRARDRASKAQFVLLLEDVSQESPGVLPPEDKPFLRIGTKTDLCDGRPHKGYDHVVSCVTGEGLTELARAMGDAAKAAEPAAGELIPWRLRHVELLGEAVAHLRRAADGEWLPLELRSEELRLAANALGTITGAIDVEDLLDVIFGQFCIGK
jgi:tRNA modification GTPase